MNGIERTRESRPGGIPRRRTWAGMKRAVILGTAKNPGRYRIGEKQDEKGGTLLVA